MKNKILSDSDFTQFVSLLEKYNYFNRKSSIPNSPEQWTRKDYLMKWASILFSFKELDQSNLKVVDIGSGLGPVPHIISDWGNDVVAIDLERISHPHIDSKVEMIQGDAFKIIDQFNDQSIDVFLDICAVTHFLEQSHKDSCRENVSWEMMGEIISRKLKMGGFFLVTTDVSKNSEFGEFLDPLYIVKTLKKHNLSLVGDFESNFETAFNMHYNNWTLQVATMKFIKNP